jgi:CubicO group peptidase (beta-lactamase class C family)
MKDLVVLVADKNMHFALRGALGRPDALGIRPIAHEFRTHIGRDGGMRTTGVELLARERGRFAHALLVFDLDGSGAKPEQSSSDLEHVLDEQLHAQWGQHAKSIVIAPELDIWLWGTDNTLRESLRWPLTGSIRSWLQGKGFVFDADGKPEQPKEALEAMVRIHRQPRSSALYEKITGRISLSRCTDPAFLRLRASLQGWFAAVP